jgi:hypothetical protein
VLGLVNPRLMLKQRQLRSKDENGNAHSTFRCGKCSSKNLFTTNSQQVPESHSTPSTTTSSPPASQSAIKLGGNVRGCKMNVSQWAGEGEVNQMGSFLGSCYRKTEILKLRYGGSYVTDGSPCKPVSLQIDCVQAGYAQAYCAQARCIICL